jgi:hypothetical protein
MNYKLILLAFLMSLFDISFGQTIKIGQEAENVKRLVEWYTRNSTGYDSYGNSKANNVVSDVKYFDGEISEVIQCYTKQFIIDFRISADFCVHYIMKNGKLSVITTQYENISVSKLKELFDKSYGDRKSGDLYFSEDYNNYSKIYLHKNGLATVEWCATNPNDLSAEINKKRKEYEESKRQRLLEDSKRVTEEAEPKTEMESRKSLSYSLNDRRALFLARPSYPGNNEGTVIITITVSNEGTVVKADNLDKNNTFIDPELIIAAKKAAMQSKFNADSNAANNQVGTITYHFTLD